jgi:hypothetical protein
MDIKTAEDYYNDIKEILNEKRTHSLTDFITFIFKNKGAREICNLTSKVLPDYILFFDLSDFEKHSFDKYRKNNEELDVSFEEEEIKDIIECNIETTECIKKYTLKLREHILTLKNNKLNFNFNKENNLIKNKFPEEKNNYLLILDESLKEEIEIFIIKIINDIVDKLTFTPKFTLDNFSKKYINFLFNRNYNIEDYSKLEDFLKEYCGNVAIDTTTMEKISLNFGDAYLKEIEFFINNHLLSMHFENECFQKFISYVYSKKIFSILKNIDIKELFHLYEIKENNDKKKICLKNSKNENEISKNVNFFINNIKNKDKCKFYIFYDSEEEYTPVSEKEFNVYDFELEKELYLSNYENQFYENISNYYADQHNLNLLIILEKTNLFDNERQIVKLHAIKLHNQKLQFINKNNLVKDFLPSKILKKYKIIIS